MKLTPAVLFCSLAVTVHGAERLLTFEKDVRPLLKTHCTHCHGEEAKPKGGVDLRLRRFMDLKIDDEKHVIVAGQPAQSELVRLIKSGEMPKKGKPMSEADLAIIEQWIAQGAKTARPEPLVLAPGPMISDDDREYWAVQPVKRPVVPL